MGKNYFFIRVRITLGLFLMISGIIALFSFGIYDLIKQSLFEDTLTRLQNIAYLWSRLINQDEFEHLVKIANSGKSAVETKDIYHSKEYTDIYSSLDFIKNSDKDVIEYVYTIIPSDEQDKPRFLVDGDYFEDLQQSASWITEFNQVYDAQKQPVLKQALKEWKNLVEHQFTKDEWANVAVISGYAPIYSKSWALLGIIGVDISDINMQRHLASSINLISIFIIVSFVAAFVLALSFSGYIVKIIGLRELLKKLEDSNKQLKDLDNKKTNFLNIASHELRTPLTAINWYLSMILDGDFWPISASVSEHLQNINRNARHLLELVSEMLDIARIDAGKEIVEISEFNIYSDLHIIAANMRIVSNAKNVELVEELTIKPESSIISCEMSFIKVVGNILWNAIKFTPSGWKVTLRVEEIESSYLVSITDTWVGIDPKDHDKIFEKFGQIGNSLTKENKWTWLWLYIAKKNLENIWGILCLDSELGKGTKFSISIPKKFNGKIE